MTEKPQVDFEEVVKASGMPVTEPGQSDPGLYRSTAAGTYGRS